MKHCITRFFSMIAVFVIYGTFASSLANAETKSGSWNLTSSSDEWTSSGCVTYFSQPYGMKQLNAYILNLNINDFSTTGITEIKIGVKSLQNNSTGSRLTVYLVDKDGNTIGSGKTITPTNASSASSTSYEYVTFNSGFTGVTGFKVQCTTFDKNVLVNGASYEVKYTPILYSINALSNNTDLGTVSLNGSVITGSPNSGCRYASPAYSITPENSATVSQDGNDFVVTPSANTTVTIIFEAIPTHTATFSVNGIATSQDYLENEAITFPDNPSDINGKTFVGWVSSTIVEPTDEVPTFVTSATMGSSDITFYAVFANSEFGSSVETKAQTLQYDNWSYHGDTSDKDSYRLFGDGSYIESALFDLSKLSKVIVYGGTYGGSSFNSLTIGDGINVWKSGTVSGSSNTGTNTFTGGTTLSGTKKLRIIATAGNGTASGLRISKVEIFVTTLSVVYSQYCTTVESAAVETPVITVDEQFSFSTAVEISCSTEGAIIYYTTDGTTPSSSSIEYTESFSITSTTTIRAIAIKGSDESSIVSATSTKVLADPTVIIDANGIYNRNLHFGTSAGSLAASVLYNNEAIEGASVTWSGNNDNVATIDENTGVVTLKAVGSVIFTASYEGSSDYDEKTDTYEMTVIQVDPSEATILFGSAVGSTSINGASKTGYDSFNNEWTITTEGTTSFTPNAAYAQVGSSNNPATSITFTTSLNEDVRISSITAKFGGFSGTAGNIVLKVGDTTVGSGSLNGTSDVTVSSTSAAAGNELTVTVTGISKGVKCYYITYTLESIIAMPFEGHYWSSFYNSSTSYKLPVGAQAFTMHNNNKLYLLGEDGSIIPSGTAVIIMADKASIALTECTSSLSDPSNILEGANSSFTIPDGKVAFVLGIAGSPASIGFFKYSGSSIPAGKAYILADE